MAYLFLAGFILTMIIGKWLYKTYTNPITFFIGVFFVAFFFLYAVDFIAYDMITDVTWVMYFVSFACFLGGIILNRGVHVRIRGTIVNENDVEAEKRKYDREIWVLFFISAVATGIYWVQAIRLRGFSGLFQSLMKTQETDNLGGLPAIILYLKMITIFLSPYVLNYIIQYKERKPVYYIIIVFTFLANIAYTRNVLFYIVLLDLFVYIFTHIRYRTEISLKWIRYVVIGITALYFFSYTQTMLNKQFDVQGAFLGNALSGPLVTIISYFTGPIVSTGIYFEQIQDVPFLGYTLRNILGFIDSFGIADIDTTIYMPQTWVYIPFKFNTTAVQLYIIKEGGWLWFVLFFLFAGYLADRVFMNYKRYKSRYTLMLLSFISLVSVTSIRSYLITRLDMLIFCIILGLLWMSRRITFGRKMKWR